MDGYSEVPTSVGYQHHRSQKFSPTHGTTKLEVSGDFADGSQPANAEEAMPERFRATRQQRSKRAQSNATKTSQVLSAQENQRTNLPMKKAADQITVRKSKKKEYKDSASPKKGGRATKKKGPGQPK